MSHGESEKCQKCHALQMLRTEKEVNFEYGNFENLTSKECLKCGGT